MKKFLLTATLALLTTILLLTRQAAHPHPMSPTLLTDPFLQNPTPTSIQVIWFTEFEGTQHRVEYGDTLTAPAPTFTTVPATTTRLTRTAEDAASNTPTTSSQSSGQSSGQKISQLTPRPIWRHAATLTGLTPGQRLPYRVISQHPNGQSITSNPFTLAATPPPNQPLKILLTSDHQLMPLVPANLQKVAETIGQVDAVFFAGDLINHADRASEWFDDASGLAFFPNLQGTSQYNLEKAGKTTTYQGGELIQHAPLFPIIGNHEVMGRYSTTEPINAQFANTLPRELVSGFYPQPATASEPKEPEKESVSDSESWIEDHSYNTLTYREIFSLPTTQLPDGRETTDYYAVTFGDVRLVSLYVTQIWRSPDLSPTTKGRYRERQSELVNPKSWGYGQHIFEPIRKGSDQYNWLQQELASDEFKSAKYTIVMLHHPPHTLGGNIVPAFTDPVAIKSYAPDGSLQAVQYEYPQSEDYIIRDLVPLLEAANVQLVFYGHSHLWNRFISPNGTHFLETSNVGNSYGAHLADNPREVPTAIDKASDLNPFTETYSAIGDPNGLEPIMPTLAPIKDEQGQALPYIASNDITSFTILDTGTGLVSSYYFDTRQPESEVVKFDEFAMGEYDGKYNSSMLSS